MRGPEPLEYGLLGPFVVRAAGGRSVEVGSPKSRALLAALLLQPGQTVPTSELADLGKR